MVTKEKKEMILNTEPSYYIKVIDNSTNILGKNPLTNRRTTMKTISPKKDIKKFKQVLLSKDASRKVSPKRKTVIAFNRRRSSNSLPKIISKRITIVESTPNPNTKK
jgi:hypothetical protein